MNSLMWLIVGILVALGIIFVFLLSKKKGKIGHTNYKSMFIIGIIFLCIHVVFSLIDQFNLHSIFLILGIVYVVIGLTNKKHWGKKVTWNDLEEKERKVKIWIIIGLLVAIILGALVFFLVR